MTSATARVPTIYLCEFHGYLFVLLPSENRAFREGMKGVGVPISANRQPTYRMLADRRPEFKALVEKHYPRWLWHQFRFADWQSIPPWAQKGVEELLERDLDALIRKLGPPPEGSES